MKACEALEALNITRPTLCKWVKEGIIKATKRPGGQYDYDEESVYAQSGAYHKRVKESPSDCVWSMISAIWKMPRSQEQYEAIYALMKLADTLEA